MSTKKAIQNEIVQYRHAEQLLQLGARVPVVMEMTHLSSWFLRKLSTEVQGRWPRKGQIPNSDQWYMRRKNHIQATLFCLIFDSLKKYSSMGTSTTELLVLAYPEWLQCMEICGLAVTMSFDRAWWLIKSVEIKNLQLAHCRRCRARYLQPWGKLERFYECEECQVKSRLNRLAQKGLACHR